jgi:hypothetical protein
LKDLISHIFNGIFKIFETGRGAENTAKRSLNCGIYDLYPVLLSRPNRVASFVIITAPGAVSSE